MTEITINAIRTELDARKDRSAWGRGGTVYAIDLLDNISGVDLCNVAAVKLALLNGADDWNAYSWSGNALIYDSDIARTLCNPSELKRTRNGERRPNAREQWLDVQARALSQASTRIVRIIRGMMAR